MSDDPLTHSSLSLQGRQVFEYSVETDANGNKFTDTLPGFYEVYVTIDGVDQVLFRRKAAGLLSDIARAKKAKDAAVPPPVAAPEQQTPPPPWQPEQQPPPPPPADQPQQ